MKLSTIGHASIYIKDSNNQPLLLTDPWLIGSAYWRSWWLQNYQSQDQFEELKKVKYCYITHEHPDHFHTPSIKKLGNKPTYLSPQLPEENITKYLRGLKFNSEVLKSLNWYKVSDEISILSVPLFNDDSVLLIDTPKAFIINLNDTKPSKSKLNQIDKFLTSNNINKKRIVLSSYSPASIVNSFRKDSKYVSIKDKKDYCLYLNKVSNSLKADYFIPFASQVIFYRPDSTWANEYKVTYEDLQLHWDSDTILLHPYTTIDLTDFKISFIETKNYLRDENYIKNKVSDQIELEKKSKINDSDLKLLSKKLKSKRFILFPLFPNGIAFITDKDKFLVNTFSGKVGLLEKNKNYSFAIKLPSQALKDAISYDHFGDLGITMFTILILNRTNNPKFIYIFFILMTFDDYKHFIDYKHFFKWIFSIFKNNSWKIPPLKTASNIPFK